MLPLPNIYKDCLIKSILSICFLLFSLNANSQSVPYGSGAEGNITINNTQLISDGFYKVTNISSTQQLANLTIRRADNTIPNHNEILDAGVLLFFQMEGPNAGQYLRISQNIHENGFEYNQGSGILTLYFNHYGGNPSDFNQFSISDKLQLVVPQAYSNLTISPNGLLTAIPYDPLSGTGGILAVVVKEMLEVQSGGQFNMDGKGFPFSAGGTGGIASPGLGGAGGTGPNIVAQHGGSTSPYGDNPDNNQKMGLYGGGNGGQGNPGSTPTNGGFLNFPGNLTTHSTNVANSNPSGLIAMGAGGRGGNGRDAGRSAGGGGGATSFTGVGNPGQDGESGGSNGGSGAGGGAGGGIIFVIAKNINIADEAFSTIGINGNIATNGLNGKKGGDGGDAGVLDCETKYGGYGGGGRRGHGGTGGNGGNGGAGGFVKIVKSHTGGISQNNVNVNGGSGGDGGLGGYHGTHGNRGAYSTQIIGECANPQPVDTSCIASTIVCYDNFQHISNSGIPVPNTSGVYLINEIDTCFIYQNALICRIGFHNGDTCGTIYTSASLGLDFLAEIAGTGIIINEDYFDNSTYIYSCEGGSSGNPCANSDAVPQCKAPDGDNGEDGDNGSWHEEIEEEPCSYEIHIVNNICDNYSYEVQTAIGGDPFFEYGLPSGSPCPNCTNYGYNGYSYDGWTEFSHINSDGCAVYNTDLWTNYNLNPITTQNTFESIQGANCSEPSRVIMKRLSPNSPIIYADADYSLGYGYTVMQYQGHYVTYYLYLANSYDEIDLNGFISVNADGYVEITGMAPGSYDLKIVFNQGWGPEGNCSKETYINFTIPDYQTPEPIITDTSSCDMFLWDISGEAYTESGNYTHNIIDTTGCEVEHMLNLTIYNSVNDTIHINNCGDFLWEENRIQYTESGIYTNTFTSSNGCDSTVVLHLNILEIQSTVTYDTICIGESYTWHNSVYHESGSYSHIVSSPDENSCLNAKLILTVLPVEHSNISAEICEGQSYNFNGQELTTAGTYQSTATNSNGCEEITTLTLTVNSVNHSSISAEICEGQSYNFNGQELTTAGTYQSTATNSNGCEEITTLTLTVNSVNHSSISAEICEGQSYSFNGQELTTAGTYQSTATNSNGCEEITTLTLTVNSVNHSNISAEICEGQSYNFNGQELTTAGTYQSTSTNSNGCEEITTLTLTVNSVNHSSISAEICEGQSYNFNGQELTTAGTYQSTATNSNGCEEITTLTLTVNSVNHSSISAEICEGQSYNFNGQELTTAGTYQSTATNSNGCEEITTLTLTVNSVNHSNISAEICEGQSYNFNGQELTTAGTYQSTSTNSNGCEEITTLTLVVNSGSETLQAGVICEGGSFDFFGQTLTESGTYTHTENCTTHTIVLTVNSNTYTQQTASICAGDTLHFYGLSLTQSGTYTATIAGNSCCKEIITLTLTVGTPVITDTTIQICQGQSYEFEGNILTESGTYTFNVMNENGCMNTTNISLTVLDTIIVHIADTICRGETYIFGSQTLTLSGNYTETFLSANGCDSTVHLTLVVGRPSFSIIQNVTICEGGHYIFHGDTLTVSGTYDTTTVNQYGCTSTETVVLTVKPNIVIRDTITICLGHQQAKARIGIPVIGEPVFPSVNCDTIFITDTIFIESPVTYVTDSICEGLPYVFGSQTLTNSGNYTEIFQANNDCDSTVHLTLIVGGSTYNYITDTICNGQTYTFCGQTYTQSGVYTCHTPGDTADTIPRQMLSTPLSTIPSGNPSYYGADQPALYSQYNANGSAIVTTGSPTGFSFEHLTHPFWTGFGNPVQRITTDLGRWISGASSFNVWYGASYNIEISESKVYHVALAADNLFRFSVNGQIILTSNPNAISPQHGFTSYHDRITFRKLHIYPIQLEAGCHVITLEGLNQSSVAMFAGAIFDNTAQELRDATNINELDILFSTETAEAFQQNSIIGCPEGYTETGPSQCDLCIREASCSNITELTLVVTDTSVMNLSPTICKGETFEFGDNILTESGFYTYYLMNEVGCMTTLNINLTVHDTFVVYISDTICRGETYQFGTQTLTQSGNYTAIFPSANGCDSTVHLTLTVGRPSLGTFQFVTICEGESYIFYGDTLTTSGTYDMTTMNEHGCSTTNSVALTVQPRVVIRDTVTICSGHEQAKARIAIPTRPFFPPLNCDTIFITDTIFVESLETHIADTICRGQDYIFGSQTLGQAGNYTEIFQSDNGCDSIVHLTLVVVRPPLGTFLFVTICEGESYIFYGDTLTTSGTYDMTTVNGHGCSTTNSVALTVQPRVVIRDTVTICSGHEQAKARIAIPTRPFFPPLNCDTIRIVDTIYIDPIVTYITDTICKGEKYEFGSQILTEPGNYKEGFKTATGCDSIVYLTLFMTEINAGIWNTNGTLHVQPGYSSYQWVNCHNNYSIIPGATGNTYSLPSKGSSVAAIITSGNCVDTTACSGIALSSVSNTVSGKIEVFPNPSNGAFNIRFSHLPGRKDINIYNDISQNVHQANTLEDQLTIRLNSPSGIYIIEIIHDKRRYFEKIIVVE